METTIASVILLSLLLGLLTFTRASFDPSMAGLREAVAGIVARVIDFLSR